VNGQTNWVYGKANCTDTNEFDYGVANCADANKLGYAMTPWQIVQMQTN